MRRLHSLLGTHPVTAPLKQGTVRSSLVQFDFADVAKPSNAFKRVVRNLEFEFAELALFTHLIALAHDKPLVLLPAVLFARFQHPYLVHDATRGALAPGDLAGKRIAIRSYSVTTVAWLRGMIEECGVDASRVTWLSTEEPHVAEFVDPPSVVRAPAGADPLALLREGKADAAILAEVPDDPRIKPVFADPAAAALAWHRKTGAVQINHMIVVKRSLARDEPGIVKEAWRMLCASREAASLSGAKLAPFGWEPNRRNLDVAIDYAYRQHLIPRRFAVDELIDDATRDF